MAEVIIQHVALVSESDSVDLADVAVVSAALQKQVTRDFAPIWQLQATVDPFGRLEDVPLGYWPMIVKDDIGFDAGGIHLDQDGQPFALINAGSNWALTASHECLEMLADPFGDRLVAGDSPNEDQGRVEFLVEVCDPSEAAEFAYTVNGVLVSDFYTPTFFDPVVASGVRYSFTGAIQEPRDVLRGGYLSWHDPVNDVWWQETWFSGNKSKFVPLGHLTLANGSFRCQMDRLTNKASHDAMQELRGAKLGLTAAVAVQALSKKASMWRGEIDELLGARGEGASQTPSASRRVPRKRDDDQADASATRSHRRQVPGHR